MQQFDRDSTFCALAEVNERNEIDYACIVYIFAVRSWYCHMSKTCLRLLTFPLQWCETIQWVRKILSLFHVFFKMHCGDSCNG